MSQHQIMETGKFAPKVLDEELIIESLREAGHKFKKKDQDYMLDVKALSISYSNILKISNIWHLKNLVKLQLNNNIIETITGLEELTNLMWLDLSFNNIKRIDGLDCLVKLEDVSLFNNKIEILKNMDTLVELQILSVGNNNISDINNITYLRRFNKLRSLTLEGNPLCQEEHYRHHTIAVLPSLTYLDYHTIDNKTRNQANKLYEVDLQKLEQMETGEEIQRRNLEEEKRMRILGKEAFVDEMDGALLMNKMFFDDDEGKLLSKIPIIRTALDEYVKKLSERANRMFMMGLKCQEGRQEEISQFQIHLSESKEQSRRLFDAELDRFISSKDKSLPILLMSSNTITQLEPQKIEELKEALMLIEVQLVDQVEDSLKDFERNLKELADAFSNQIRTGIAELRQLNSAYYNKILSESPLVLEKVLTNELDDNFLSEELRNILIDKDNLQNAAKSSHEAHIQVLDNLEDDIISKLNLWVSVYIKDVQKKEVSRNRGRVHEITHLIDSLKDEDLDDLELA